MATAFNEDHTRCITDDQHGGILADVVGYEGQIRDGQFEGTHAGAFRTVEDAEAWLRGEGPGGLTITRVP